ncbi:glutathione-dependent formaldehyde dehydrogenase [Rhizobium sp. NBRC 114257]|uniref:Glutathione-dependent formaldehyde dehydrogenase n=1 Tax=Rhizobium dioscoreae TaxID=2653122 RepID=A0ABQ0Z7H1_9HYPH|nr:MULTISPECIES: zinc-dependent alcohol dehydrogenase [Rhizobium]GES51464.1 glutathione-dependent formaldehyde dehydrogenase [Rhizobium dioscoreae]GLU82916.1 glutathione-dependent formaldehyde dehydrogenase [Rhizobium sp. NBRC 114257]
MKALTWHGKHDIRCESVPDPRLDDERDIIIKVTACAICGSDLHLYDGVMPAMESGDIMGHETMGEVVEVGKGVSRLAVGDRVVVPFTIACGECFFCQRGFFSGCERTNPDRSKVTKLWGNSPAGLFGYSHLLGGYSGGQAEYLRVPYGDVGPAKVPNGLDDEQVLFLSDIFPTGYMAAEFCSIQQGDTIAIWGCGPVGQMAIRSAFLLGAERVIAIDTVPTRLLLAEAGGAETVNFLEEDVYDRIMEMTRGRGADACIDAVGTEAEASASWASRWDRIKVATFMGTDRPHVLRQAIHCCRNFGTVSIVGVYGGYLDKIPMGSAINRGLTFKMAQTPVQHYLPMLMERIEKGEIDPSFVVTHRGTLEDGPDLYKLFRDKQDGCVKVVLKP